MAGPGGRDVHSVFYAPSNPDVVYIGTGESEIRGNIMMGDGLYKTTDAGKTWTHLGLDATHHIGRIAVDPKNADIALVAAIARPSASEPEPLRVEGIDLEPTEMRTYLNFTVYADDP